MFGSCGQLDDSMSDELQSRVGSVSIEIRHLVKASSLVPFQRNGQSGACMLGGFCRLLADCFVEAAAVSRFKCVRACLLFHALKLHVALRCRQD